MMLPGLVGEIFKDMATNEKSHPAKRNGFLFGCRSSTEAEKGKDRNDDHYQSNDVNNIIHRRVPFNLNALKRTAK